MVNRMQERKIKCPYCGWVRTVPITAIQNASMTDVTRDTMDTLRGLGDSLKEIGHKIASLLSDSQLDAANAWIDMPKCPHCQNVYRYNVRTGEAAK